MNRIIVVIVFLLSPIDLQLIGSGDSFLFIIFSILFISLYFLVKGCEKIGIKRLPYFLVSTILFSITVAQPQITYLGLLLYLSFLFYFMVIDNKKVTKSVIIGFVKTSFYLITLIILLIMPLILTSFMGLFNFSPSSSYANPLTNFYVYSATFFNMLTFNTYPTQPITLIASINSIPWLSTVWYFAIYLFVSVLLISGVVTKNKRMVYFDLIVLMGALFGSGANSPISAINIYFYKHLVGYQLVNASYYWEWIIILPAYCVILGLLIQQTTSKSIDENVSKMSFYFKNLLLIRRLKLNKNKFITLLVVLLLSFIAFIPLISGSYYGPGGIHKNQIPNDYNYLENFLGNKIKKTTTGVAYFTQDNYIRFNLTGNPVDQPLQLGQNLRTPGVPAYLVLPTQQNYFFYWAYYMFYANLTKNIAQIMGIVGIKYFVTLNNVESASTLFFANGINATKLMNYQDNLIKVYSSANYTVFKSDLSIDTAHTVSNFSLFSSNYNTFVDASKLGINLSTLNPVFFSDLNATNFNFFYSHTSTIISSSNQGPLTLAISKFMSPSMSFFPANSITNHNLNIDTGWVNSQSIYFLNLPYTLSIPGQIAITKSSSSLSLLKSNLKSGQYDLWFNLLDSPNVGGKLEITVNGQSQIISSHSNSTNLGGLFWKKVDYNTKGGQINVNITSISGVNGIYTTVITKKGEVSKEFSNIEQKISTGAIAYLNISNLSKGQFLVKDIVNKINNSSGPSENLFAGNNANGYYVKGCVSSINIIDYNFYPGMIPSSDKYYEIPDLNGLNSIIISKNNLTYISFVSYDYNLVLYGVSIYISTISTSMIFYIIYYIHRKRTKRY